MTTPTPTPGALSADELLLMRWRDGEDVQDALAHALKRTLRKLEEAHTTRPDVDALVKALENLCRETEISGDSDSGAYWSAKDALARHAKGGATG